MQIREVGIRRHALAVLACLVIVAATSRGLAAPQGDTDWPCQQRLMPTIGAGSLWTGPALDSAGDWTAEPRVAALVAEISPRNVPADDGVAAIGAFAESLGSGEDKQHLLTLAFAGLLAETNQERGDLIARLEDLGRRQHKLADIASHAAEELRRVPADATGEDAAKRTDLQQRLTFVTQAFENTQRTMRYACEAPTRLEARLGRYAQAIQSRL